MKCRYRKYDARKLLKYMRFHFADSEVEILEEVDDESRLIITSVESLQGKQTYLN